MGAAGDAWRDLVTQARFTGVLIGVTSLFDPIIPVPLLLLIKTVLWTEGYE